MPRPALPPIPANVVTARLSDGRHLIARLDPATPHSPLQRALHVAGVLGDRGKRLGQIRDRPPL